MASKLLTNTSKKDLRKKLLVRAYKTRVQDLIDRSADFADRVYREAFKKDLFQIESLPDGWLPTQHYLRTSIAGSVTVLYFSGSWGSHWIENLYIESGGETKSAKSRKYPQASLQLTNGLFDARSKIAKEYAKLGGEHDDLTQEILLTAESIWATLCSATTTKKLAEIWPEVADLLKPYEQDGENKILLPAIQREELNAALDLPPETASDKVADGTVA